MGYTRIFRLMIWYQLSFKPIHLRNFDLQLVQNYIANQILNKRFGTLAIRWFGYERSLHIFLEVYNWVQTIVGVILAKNILCYTFALIKMRYVITLLIFFSTTANLPFSRKCASIQFFLSCFCHESIQNELDKFREFWNQFWEDRWQQLLASW